MNNYPDAMISISLDRQAEKVGKVQSYGLSQMATPVAPSVLTGRALAMVLVVVGTLLLGLFAR